MMPLNVNGLPTHPHIRHCWLEFLEHYWSPSLSLNLTKACKTSVWKYVSLNGVTRNYTKRDGGICEYNLDLPLQHSCTMFQFDLKNAFILFQLFIFLTCVNAMRYFLNRGGEKPGILVVGCDRALSVCMFLVSSSFFFFVLCFEQDMLMVTSEWMFLQKEKFEVRENVPMCLLNGADVFLKHLIL